MSAVTVSVRQPVKLDKHFKVLFHVIYSALRMKPADDQSHLSISWPDRHRVNCLDLQTRVTTINDIENRKKQSVVCSVSRQFGEKTIKLCRCKRHC